MVRFVFAEVLTSSAGVVDWFLGIRATLGHNHNCYHDVFTSRQQASDYRVLEHLHFTMWMELTLVYYFQRHLGRCLHAVHSADRSASLVNHCTTLHFECSL